MSELSFTKVSRRKFLGTTALAVAASQIGSLPFAPQARAQSKTLRIAAGEADGPSGTLDPALSVSDPDAARIALVLERLVVLDDTFAPQPQLAESWSSNDSASEWTFKLRPGVTFHNGSKLTAEDVVYTYKRLLDPKTASPGAPSLKVIDPNGITAADELTVTFKLPSAVVEFPSLLANRFGYIVSKDQPAEELRTKAAGTGPFKVQKFVPGEEPSVFVKNENYWRQGLPKVDAVELRAIPEESARVAAIASGQIDLVWDLPRTGLKTLEDNKDVNVVSVRSPFVMTMSAWCDTPPFDDAKVREAMKYAVDREKMLKLVLGGRGNMGDDNPVAPWVKYALKTEPRAYDPQKAKQLLAEAGHPDGIDIELYTSDTTPGFIEMATLYKASAEPAGIRVNLVRAPANDYWSNTWLKQPFVCSSWAGRDADDALSVAYLSDAEWNETHWRRPEFDNLIKQARQTLDEAKRTEFYQQAQRMVREDGGALISMFPDAIGATRANVTGWKLHPQQYSKDFSQVEFTS
ncbi:ABC transporter substrate-binding protein [Rhodoligotrophos defluvii]|uniref:ABC transporter substrate-binding protein n=1 Tax=Rhodoligotrophos defluvii TaxID=2561934 RepID=UPI0010C9B394|nr:ABC transporter substrate-binding protein [Rhodoligotrophos defluvii]